MTNEASICTLAILSDEMANWILFGVAFCTFLAMLYKSFEGKLKE